jgi:hypothetical protein
VREEDGRIELGLARDGLGRARFACARMAARVGVALAGEDEYEHEHGNEDAHAHGNEDEDVCAGRA